MVSRRLLAGGALCALAILPAAMVRAADPLHDNLKKLEKRIEKKQPAAPAPARAPRPHHPRHHAATPAAENPGPAVYSKDRIGKNSKAGDLRVTVTPPTGVHVYLSQRMLSDEGNGQGSAPDVKPGKYPVLVWSPESGKRRTYWVTIRAGSLASLQASL